MKTLLPMLAAAVLASALSLNAADVKENWTTHCAKCHGEDGKGDTKMGKKVGVKDYTSAAVQAEMKDDKMAKAIKEGVKDPKESDKTLMKGFGDVLSDDEIKALVGHVRGLKK